MPVPVAATLLAVLLAGLLALATPRLLRWLPVPPDEPDVAPFSELDSSRFRWRVFGTAAAAGVVAFNLTGVTHWAVWAPLVTLGSLLASIDLRTGFLPLRLHYLALALAGAGTGLAAWLLASWQPLLWAAVAGLLATGFFWLVWRFSGGRLGFGDVRLAGLIGVVTGATSTNLTVWSFLLGTFAGAAWGLVLGFRRGRDGEFPYGPALLLGPVLALVVSSALRLG